MAALATPFSSSYSINGQPATRAAFLHESWPIFAVFPPVLMLFGAITYALRNERPWSRRLMLVFWLVNIIAAAGVAISPLGREAEMWLVVPEYVVFSVIAWWYLYRKPSVVMYYALLEDRAKDAAAGEPPRDVPGRQA